MKSANLNIVNEDFVKLAKSGSVNVLVHMCNCFASQNNQISAFMEREFGSDAMKLEQLDYYGDIDKLGRIDHKVINNFGEPFYLINAYVNYRNNELSKYGVMVDYDALTICLRKINKKFPSTIVCIPYEKDYPYGPKMDILIKIINKELRDCEEVIISKI